MTDPDLHALAHLDAIQRARGLDDPWEDYDLRNETASPVSKIRPKRITHGKAATITTTKRGGFGIARRSGKTCSSNTSTLDANADHFHSGAG